MPGKMEQELSFRAFQIRTLRDLRVAARSMSRNLSALVPPHLAAGPESARIVASNLLQLDTQRLLLERRGRHTPSKYNLGRPW